MNKQQIIDKIMASGNFQWKNYADHYHLHGRDHDITLDNIELHLHTQDLDFLNMMYEANCWEEAQSYYEEVAGYNNRDITQDEFNAMMYVN